MAKSLLEAILRRAIRQGGTVDYNPDMYDYGFADNITPSSEFNEKLKKYGHLKYNNMPYDEFNSYDDSWSSFIIDERGRAYIEEIDKKKDGPFKIKKILRFIFISFLLGFCLPIAIVVGVEIGLAWLLCNIDTGDTYSWISGFFHGLFIVPNYVRHLFSEDILYFAEYHTTAYTIFYWISAIVFVLPSHVKTTFQFIADLIKDWVQSN